ncbi:MAG: endonuclease/exonuclease/phosphatase family protein [Chloroflexota bacterium]
MTNTRRPANGSCLREVIHILGLLFALGMAALLIANHFLRQTSPFITLAGTFNHLLFVAALPLVLGLILLRTRTGFITALLIVALFLLAHPVFPPVSAVLRAGDDQPTLSAMTFNLGWYLTPPELLARTIAETSADIVAVQEMSAESAYVLASELTAIYPYQILDPGTGTTGFLSKLPIISYEWLYPPTNRPFLHVVVEHGGRPLHIFPIHFYSPGLRWSGQLPLPEGMYEADLEEGVAYLLQQIAGISGPVVVLGDFNMSDQSHAYSAITAVLDDSYRQAGYGLGLTFPNNVHLSRVPIPFPLVRIDYVFYSDPLRAVSAQVNCVEGQSDHCSVFVELGESNP